MASGARAHSDRAIALPQPEEYMRQMKEYATVQANHGLPQADGDDTVLNEDERADKPKRQDMPARVVRTVR